MKDGQPDYGILEIPLAIPADWTQDQARAVAESLQDLLMAIMSHYQLYDDDGIWDQPMPASGEPHPALPEPPPFDDDLPF